MQCVCAVCMLLLIKATFEFCALLTVQEVVYLYDMKLAQC